MRCPGYLTFIGNFVVVEFSDSFPLVYGLLDFNRIN